MFERYYRALVRKGNDSAPHADEAKRDYAEAMRLLVDGYMGL